MELVNVLSNNRELVVFVCSVAVFQLGAWYGRTVERSEQQRRDRARARFNYRNK
jgi:hypothetical protein